MYILGIITIILTILSSLIATSDDIWKLCGNVEEHLFQLNDFIIEPNPPRIGSIITLTLNGTLRESIEAGYVYVDLKAGIFRLVDRFDLCENIDPYTCPLEEGEQEFKFKNEIPSEIPPLPVKGEIQFINSREKMISCIQLEFFLRPPKVH